MRSGIPTGQRRRRPSLSGEDAVHRKSALRSTQRLPRPSRPRRSVPCNSRDP